MTGDPPNRLGQEERVRRKLQEQFGVSLRKRHLPIEGVLHEFDFVSEDGLIVGEVKTSGEGIDKPSDSRLQTIFGDISRDCLLLLALPGVKKRIFCLTNQLVYSRFMDSKFGRAAKALGIEVRHVVLD